MENNITEKYDIEQARKYWKFAPSALGKVDTSELLKLNDEDFKNTIYPHLSSRFFFASEDIPLINHFCNLFKDKRILAIGSGIGHEEIQFLKAGAEVICTDIVETNLKVIERICRIENLNGFSSILIKDPANTEFPQNIDYVWGRGVLQAMPFSIQKELIKKLKSSLNKNGGMIFSVYTKDFVSQTHDTEDPTVFARYSDPSVGDCHNPWSEWYDDEKMSELIGNDMYLSHKNIWGQSRCAWYEILWKPDNYQHKEPLLFLDLEEYENKINIICHTFNLREFSEADAEISFGKDNTLKIQTKKNQYHYAALSPIVELDVNEFIDVNIIPDKLSCTINVIQGGVGLGVLDVDNDKMIISKAVLQKGLHTHYFYLNVAKWPRRYQFIISNFCPYHEDISVFEIKNINFLKINMLSFLRPFCLPFPIPSKTQSV